MIDQQEKYLDLFVSEAVEHLDLIDTLLIDLEKEPTHEPTMLELMRHSHTLKGIAASVGFGEISNLAHSFEGMVENIKNKLSNGGFTLLFGAVDELRRLVAVAQKSGKKQAANPLVDQVGELEQTDLEADSATIENPEMFNQIKEIRVRTTKLDQLMGVVSEMIVNRLRLADSIDQQNQVLVDAFEEYYRLSQDLQYQVLQLRLTPIGQVFNRFPRMVRDQAKKQNKNVELNIVGSEIEIDRAILDDLGEPLVHLLRNAVDHGIADQGRITLKAQKVRGQVEVIVADTGQGVNWEKVSAKMADQGYTGPKEEFLFSGITTKDEVSETSGRGVGLSVVKKKIEALGGSIKLESQPGQGTTFTITLPVSLAIIKGMIIKISGQRFALPLNSMQRIIDLKQFKLITQADQPIVVIDEQEVPVITGEILFKYHTFGEAQLPEKVASTSALQRAVLVAAKNKLYALVIEDIESQQDIIVKPVSEVFRTRQPFTSVTIMGDGRPVPIIDPEILISFTQQMESPL